MNKNILIYIYYMEALIPIVALGGLAMSVKNDPKPNSSNQSKMKGKPITENYQNMNSSNQALKNSVSSYPNNTTNIQHIKNAYVNPNDATAKYFDQNSYYQADIRGKQPGNNIHQFHSLTGSQVSSTDFQHNNMTPYFGGKTTQQTIDGNRSDSMLDNMTGAGRNTITKQERAPLFKPEENVQWSHGQPNMNDFFQSRSVAGTKFSNTKPFESEMVGPGINQGYGSKGSGGYNSSLEARDAYMPKSVDDLRVATNPKMQYSLENHQGPAGHFIKKTGVMGKMEQHKPDTFFIQTEDRWLKTTSSTKAQSARPQQEVPTTARMFSQSYTGVATAGEKNANYITGEYQEAHRQDLSTNPLLNVAGPDAGFNVTRIKDSYDTVTNNRDLNNEATQTFGSGFTSAVGAVIAPLTDILNPTKKQETIDNMRIYGNPESKVEKQPIFDPNDVLPTTIKETTLHAPNGYIQSQNNDAYLVTQHQVAFTHRPTTNAEAIGIAGGPASKYGTTDRSGKKRTNAAKDKVMSTGRTEHGNMQIFNTQLNVKTAKREKDRNNNRMWAPSNMPSKSMSKELYGKMVEPTHNQQNIAVERMAPELLTAFKGNPYTHSLTGTSLR